MSEKLLTPTQLFTLKTPEPANLNLCPPGIYKATPQIENAPVKKGNGIIISTEHKASDKMSTISQLYFDLSGTAPLKIYWRNCINGIWGYWDSYY